MLNWWNCWISLSHQKMGSLKIATSKNAWFLSRQLPSLPDMVAFFHAYSRIDFFLTNRSKDTMWTLQNVTYLKKILKNSCRTCLQNILKKKYQQKHLKFVEALTLFPPLFCDVVNKILTGGTRTCRKAGAEAGRPKRMALACLRDDVVRVEALGPTFTIHDHTCIKPFM